MLKAAALCAMPNEERETVDDLLPVQPQFNQNIIIESPHEEDTVPEGVISLAYRMMEHDELMKEIINELRTMYINKREEFHFSMNSFTETERDTVIHLFQDMFGIVSSLYYCHTCNLLNGKLSLSARAQKFISGQYLELALYKESKRLLDVLSKKHDKPYQLYRNVKVSTAEGRLKNEFDLVIKFNRILYVIEVKSGKNFREFDKYMSIGKDYGIVPDRFLLVDNYLSAEQADVAEYFCEYYVSNLQNGNFAKKLTEMIERDL